MGYFEYRDLAPIDNIENGDKYIEALNWAFQNKKVKNIALTGPYGAGKSSVIETFLAQDDKKNNKGFPFRANTIRKKSLKISMATFFKGKALENAESGEKIEVDADEVEKGILKQLFYKVEPGKIPQSRYRKIHKIKLSPVMVHIFGAMTLITFLSAIFAPEKYNTFVQTINNFLSIESAPNIKTYSFMGILFLVTAGVIAYLYRTVISRFRIKEVKLPSDTTIQSGREESDSVFNKNLDEIMYFFEATGYDLIMKNKELLLDRDPKRSPVRFIFSHSALREGWDNPNVFQICTLKQSGSDVRKRQEVGRGLRLCVNQDGERQDANVLGNDVHNINILTVIASESYDSFAKGLQSEIAEAVADRPRAITVDLFVGKVIKDSSGHEQVIDKDIADAIMYDLIINRYIDKKGALTDKYYEEKANGTLQVAEEVADCAASVVEIIGSIYDPKTMQPENARSNNVELHVDEEKIAMPEFKALWSKINAKSVYIVDFDTDELVQKAIASLDAKLRVAKIFFKVESGVMEEIKSKEALESGAAFIKETSASYGTQTRISVNSSVKYDLVGKLVEETKLTRKDIIAILRGIQKPVFEQFKDNPEEFIIKAAALINDEKATAIIQHITYDVLDERYGTEVFTDPTIRGKLGVNAMKAKKHLYDHVVFDSTNERDFAAELDTNTDVAVYVKLPDGFYISTPVGHYNPDWAIAFYEGKVKHMNTLFLEFFKMQIKR